jgi:hypothetical protein
MHDDDPPKQFFAAEVRRLRHEFIHGRLRAHVEEWFAKYSELQSSMFLVAQYWADNAWDEVHMRLVFSELSTPDLTTALTRDHIDQNDPQNLPVHMDLNYTFRFRPPESFTTNIELRDEYAIPMFAAFCKGGGFHQDSPAFDSFSPCATFRRSGEGLMDIEVAPMLRPWLDGVALASQWDEAANHTERDPSEDQFAPRWMKEQREAPKTNHGSKKHS